MANNAWLALGGSILAVAALSFLLVWNSDTSVSVSSDQPLVIYCAAGLKPPVDEIARAYERAYGRSIQLQYGGSGMLLSNIRIVARGDLYLAADRSYIDQAKQQGLVDEVMPLARIRPVIVVKKSNPKHIETIEDAERAWSNRFQSREVKLLLAVSASIFDQYRIDRI